MNEYNNVDYFSFQKLNQENGIEWFEKEKKSSSDYKNSTIFTGINKKGQKLLCLKKIPLGNIDFEHINQPSLQGDNMTVWREIIITKKLQEIHRNNNSCNFVHYYTSFMMSEENDAPFIALLFDYVPFTLHEVLKIASFTVDDEAEFLLQFSFLMMYMDKVGIHHKDIHWKNIMVDIPLEPKRLHLQYKNLDLETYPQKKIFYMIDYGCSEIHFNKSNFHEWREFLSTMFNGNHPILKCQSYADVFKYFHEKNMWTFVKKKFHLKT